MRLFMIFIALVIAIFAGVGVWFASTPQGEPESSVVVAQPEATQVEVRETSILVARQDIPVGHRLTEDDIDRMPWPSHLVHEEFKEVGEEMSLIDMVARTPFKAREPFTQSRLANPNDPGFLAAQVSKGKRAVTIPVDSVTGINGFVFPGDRVDIIVSHKVGLENDFKMENASARGEKGGENNEAVTAMRLPVERKHKVPLLMAPNKYGARPVINITEVLINNVKVLAVGHQSYQYESTERTPTNITVEVDELQAQKLRHAETGTLSLALRSLDDAQDETMPRPVGDSDMSRLTPPAYFPYVYDSEQYPVKQVELEATDYSSAEEIEENRNDVAIIRGVKKEIVGVAHP